MGSEAFWDNLFELAGSPATWLKALVILLAAPVWVPIARSMVREVREVLAPTGGLWGTAPPRPMRARPPGEDPFLNIPLPSRRRTFARAEPQKGVVPAARRSSSPSRTAGGGRRRPVWRTSRNRA